MTFVEREETEGLAQHLLRNAVALQLTRSQVARLREAWRLGSGTKRERSRGGQIASAVNAEVAASASVSLTVAVARGETVIDFNDAGAKRIRQRDGVWSLREAGSLTEAESQVALAYRLLFEQAGTSAGLGSQLGDPDRARKGSSGSDGALAAGLLRAYAGVRLTGAERAVSAVDPSGLTLAVLRAVAGEGRALRSVSGGGNQTAASLARFKQALKTVFATLSAQGGLRITAR